MRSSQPEPPRVARAFTLIKLAPPPCRVCVPCAPRSPLFLSCLPQRDRIDECTWTVGNVDGKRAVQVTMEKNEPVTWDALEVASGGKLI